MKLRRLFLCVCLLLFAASNAPQAQSGNDIDGMYLVSGLNPIGKPYRGTAEIVTQGDIVHIQWSIELANGPNEESIGFGFISHGLLAVVATSPQTISVVTYTLAPGQPLQGQWVIYGALSIYTEQLTRAPAGHPKPDAPAPQQQRVKPDTSRQRGA